MSSFIINSNKFIYFFRIYYAKILNQSSFYMKYGKSKYFHVTFYLLKIIKIKIFKFSYVTEIITCSIFNTNFLKFITLCEKCPNSEFFWSIFSCSQTEYGDVLGIQSDCGKIWTRKIPNPDSFHTVLFSIFILLVHQYLFVLTYVLHNYSK